MASSFQVRNMVFLMVASTAIGVAAALYLRPDDWSVLRTVVLGAFGGAASGSLLIASRAIGAFDPEDPNP
jgi:hypothetical protein